MGEWREGWASGNPIGVFHPPITKRGSSATPWASGTRGRNRDLRSVAAVHEAARHKGSTHPHPIPITTPPPCLVERVSNPLSETNGAVMSW